MIKLENISRIYRMGNQEVRALDSVSLEIKKGEFISIIGPSGSGKSTLMHIMGLIDIPTSGRVILDGVDVYSGKGKKKVKDSYLTGLRLRKIGFVFQQFYLLPTMTALENVELPMKEAGVPRQERKERAKKLLADVGLEHRMEHFPKQMSGGEQQRVAIARALANSPEILLADEPTGEVDSKTSERIMETFRKLNREDGITLVVVTHDPSVAGKADRILRMKDGKIESTSVHSHKSPVKHPEGRNDENDDEIPMQ